MRERVLITGARAPAALEMARCFAAAGCEVHMADCAPCRMARWSRAATRVHRYPAPREDAAGFAAAMMRLASEIAPLLIVPACEEVFHLASVEALRDRLFAPPLADLRRLHSKQLFAEACLPLGLPVPETMRVSSGLELSAFRAESVAYVFKPEYSRFGSRTLVGPDASTLDASAPSVTAPWVVQRRIKGVEVSFFAASVKSRLVAFSAYRSAWRFDGGAGYAFEPVEARLFQRMREIAEAMASRLVAQGQFACDVIVDEAGDPWLLECNPRTTSGVFMFERSAELALAILGRREEPAMGGTAASHVGPALWFYGLPEALRRNRMGEWTALRQASRDVISAPRDRAPLFGALLDTMAFGGKALAKGQGLAEVMTADIEWNGEEL